MISSSTPSPGSVSQDSREGFLFYRFIPPSHIDTWFVTHYNESVGEVILICGSRTWERWNPRVDFNVFMDMQLHHLATRPEYFGLAGIEAWTSYYGTEEYNRWLSRLFRHFGLEGKTNRLSKDPYILTHIKNGDFVDGDEGWTLEPAARGSIAFTSHKGYGTIQEFYPYLETTPTSLLLTRRSQDRPNVFSQEIKNLKPGRMYILKMTTGDNQEFIKGKSTPQDHVVSVRIENGEIVDDWYRTKSFKDKKANQHRYATWLSAGKFNGDNRFCMNVHTRIFRAKASTAKLIVSDWKTPNDSGGPVGQELVFNAIEIKPYFEIESMDR